MSNPKRQACRMCELEATTGESIPIRHHDLETHEAVRNTCAKCQHPLGDEDVCVRPSCACVCFSDTANRVIAEHFAICSEPITDETLDPQRCGSDLPCWRHSAKCPECNGRGGDEYGMYECSACHGTGRTRASTR